MEMKNRNAAPRAIKRGDIYFANLNPVIGCEQKGIMPAVVISNNIGNRFSPTVIVAAVTCQLGKAPIPTHAFICNYQPDISKRSLVLTEQIRTIDTQRLICYLGRLDADAMEMVDTALAISVGLAEK